MKLYMDGKLISSKDQPLVVVLTKKDKKNIAAMPKDFEVYCEFEKENCTRDEIERLADEAKKLNVALNVI